MSSAALLLAVDLAALSYVVVSQVRRARSVASAAAAWPPCQALFVDCDDCVYQNDWATAAKITTSIAAYTVRIGVSKEQAYALYQKHGTCLKGLLAEGLLDESGAEAFLHEVHLIDYSDIAPDPILGQELARLAVPSWIFTASTSEHAKRCLERVGIGALPWRGVIDTRSCKLETKHSPSSFEAAMREAGVSDPRRCVFCDDSVKNIKAAKAVGWRTVLVGLYDRDNGSRIVCQQADAHIASLHGLRGVLPELFS